MCIIYLPDQVGCICEIFYLEYVGYVLQIVGILAKLFYYFLYGIICLLQLGAEFLVDSGKRLLSGVFIIYAERLSTDLAYMFFCRMYLPGCNGIVSGFYGNTQFLAFLVPPCQTFLSGGRFLGGNPFNLRVFFSFKRLFWY